MNDWQPAQGFLDTTYNDLDVLHNKIYVYMYVCMYVCMYVYTYIYIYWSEHVADKTEPSTYRIPTVTHNFAPKINEIQHMTCKLQNWMNVDLS